MADIKPSTGAELNPEKFYFCNKEKHTYINTYAHTYKHTDIYHKYIRLYIQTNT